MKEEWRILLTIFTPSYNRAYIMERLYRSLQTQTCFDFEWLVVDDGSSDGTDDLLKEWMSEKNKFEIEFLKQRHGGKHRAMNRALDEAHGEYFFTVDSDDFLVDDAVERIIGWTKTIEGQKGFCGVSGLRMTLGDETGHGVSRRGNDDFVDATNFEREKYGLLGDKAEVYRTDLLRQYKFPEFDDEDFVTEGVAYQELAAKGYKIRWFFEPIYVCEYLSDGLTKRGANSITGRVKNYRGYCYYVKRALVVQPFRYRYAITRDFLETLREMGKGMAEGFSDLGFGMFAMIKYIGLMPVSFVANKIYKWYNKCGNYGNK